MKVIIWTPYMVFHLYETWIAFQQLEKEPIQIVAWNLLDNARREQGWVAQDDTGLNIRILSKRKWWSEGRNIISKNPDSIHIFIGFWTIRAYFPLLLYSLSHGVKTAVLTEPYSTSFSGYSREEPYLVSWMKVKTRPILYRLNALLTKIISKDNQLCIFSLSLLAREQFIKAGFDEKTIFPFGYFVLRKNGDQILRKGNKGDLRLVFVGSLIGRKGLDIAIQAVETLNVQGYRISLDIFGPGDPNSFISPLSKSIHYKGIIPQGEAQRVIADYDLLILPSRHDGWGVVVNEALLQGIPVIVSDHVGAKCLIEQNKAGIVFRSENVEDLMNQLRGLLESPSLLDTFRTNAEALYKDISPEISAKYLYDALSYHFYHLGTRPQALWCE